MLTPGGPFCVECAVSFGTSGSVAPDPDNASALAFCQPE